MTDLTQANIIKSSGKEEAFHKGKFCESLVSAGAPEAMVTEICEKVAGELEPGMTTSDLFRKASRYLMKKHPKAGVRYGLKQGVADLGPAGFLFEQFVETALQALGHKTKRNQMMQGHCVDHEIDVLGEKDNTHYLIEAKYHNKKGIKTPLDVVMYAGARCEDIAKHHREALGEKKEHCMWLFTNTKFTSKAIAYARCRGIKLTGWDYPKEENLQKLIERHALYPVTVLPSVGHFEREQFAKENIMLARDLAPLKPLDLVKKHGIDEKTAREIIKEAHTLVYGEEGEGE